MKQIDSKKWDIVNSIDLSFIKDRMIRKHNWSKDRTDNAIKRYKQYLYIVSVEEKGVCPTPDTDQVWHDHILHTKKYMEHCELIFGRFLHHQPFSSLEEKENSYSLLLSDLGPKYFEDQYPSKTDETVSVECCSDDSECCSTFRTIQVE